MSDMISLSRYWLVNRHKCPLCGRNANKLSEFNPGAGWKHSCASCGGQWKDGALIREARNEIQRVQFRAEIVSLIKAYRKTEEPA